ncbi:MAG: type II toxin-antitoxin system RelE/ParE family toxin, partial [Betaproteobacteria bacterium]
KPFDDVGAGSVLHCFQKKTQATSKQDKAIAEARYRAVVNARKAQK